MLLSTTHEVECIESEPTTNGKIVDYSFTHKSANNMRRDAPWALKYVKQ